MAGFHGSLGWRLDADRSAGDSFTGGDNDELGWDYDVVVLGGAIGGALTDQ
jgi:hypothetical protein